MQSLPTATCSLISLLKAESHFTSLLKTLLAVSVVNSQIPEPVLTPDPSGQPTLPPEPLPLGILEYPPCPCCMPGAPLPPCSQEDIMWLYRGCAIPVSITTRSSPSLCPQPLCGLPMPHATSPSVAERLITSGLKATLLQRWELLLTPAAHGLMPDACTRLSETEPGLPL